MHPNRSTAEKWNLPAVPPPPSPEAGATLSRAEFEKLSNLLYKICGINLKDGKEQLVKARLWKRIQQLGLGGFQDYVDILESPGAQTEISFLVDALSTNKTSFFRESQHFDFLREQLRGPLREVRSLRIWSAGCSSGEEPYTLAITILEQWGERPDRDVRILATDISSRVLDRAKDARYEESQVAEVPEGLRRRYFEVDRDPSGQVRYRVGAAARGMIRFARLNLMDDWPMRGPFDMIFCRNVMIYFDRPTQQRLVERYYELLRPQGLLFVGHSESLTGRAGAFQYVMPAVYRK